MKNLYYFGLGVLGVSLLALSMNTRAADEVPDETICLASEAKHFMLCTDLTTKVQKFCIEIGVDEGALVGNPTAYRCTTDLELFKDGYVEKWGGSVTFEDKATLKPSVKPNIHQF